MYSAKQKILIAALGGIFAAQGVAIAEFARTAFKCENQAKGLLEIAKKHQMHFDADDLQSLRNLDLLKAD